MLFCREGIFLTRRNAFTDRSEARWQHADALGSWEDYPLEKDLRLLFLSRADSANVVGIDRYLTLELRPRFVTF